jgi:hypothetical protein
MFPRVIYLKKENVVLKYLSYILFLELCMSIVFIFPNVILI